MGWRATATFYEQLRLLLKAGIDLGKALAMLGERIPAGYARRLPAWRDGVDRGRPLSELLRESGEPPFPTAVVAAGEQSGHLPELLSDVVAFYEFAIAIRNMVIGRLIYPLFLLHVALVGPVFVLWIIASLTGKGGFSGWWVLSGPLALWLGGLLLWLLCRGGLASGLLARLGSLPLIKGVVRPLAAANVCLVLHAAVKGGALFPDALRLAASCASNRVWTERLLRAATDLRAERLSSLTEALATTDMPREVLDLVQSGELSGGLDDTLKRSAVLQRDRFENRITWAARILMGFILAIAMLAMVIAIFTLAYQAYWKPMQEAMHGL